MIKKAVNKKAKGTVLFAENILCKKPWIGSFKDQGLGGQASSFDPKAFSSDRRMP